MKCLEYVTPRDTKISDWQVLGLGEVGKECCLGTWHVLGVMKMWQSCTGLTAAHYEGTQCHGTKCFKPMASCFTLML